MIIYFLLMNSKRCSWFVHSEIFLVGKNVSKKCSCSGLDVKLLLFVSLVLLSLEAREFSNSVFTRHIS